MCGFLLTLLLSFFLFNGSSEGSHDSSAVVVGTVYCDTCFHQDFPRTNHFISGATVAVECEDSKSSRPRFRQQVKTNKHGEFRVHLPFSVSKHVKKIEGCSVKLIKSSEPYCAVASSAASSAIHLKSRKRGGARVFSAGFFTFKPLKQPLLCNQKPSVDSLKQLRNKPPPSSVHPNQLLPPPVLPPNPFLPPPLLPPSPLQPPPLLPPNPLQPPPSPLVPNPLQPPPAPVTPSLHPIPGLPPSPPSSPSPEFPFPLPPFPFTPIPPFPGVPPAKSSP
ncbi:hypothetical protein F3Y22_tig00110548pilonHSYRG00785 [Hibiscus syriacus]|uniref:Pollen Ole e 1 allergen and extensin family protein n=1 Tax=Hibiscus syriacus TaxID=106335 RepID=A0A6A3ABM1_HIBSY|nr:amyloid beta A4 precursor protein-binding family B member 1-interacting protein-like [Hibiscus syriacus]KAE8701333.1 hypothetical protein F3Y22_tig00110548pilonHSYRG00785 [Hibiscus syriacus]